MAYRQGLKPKKPSQRAIANNNSSASSTTSSSRQFPEPSIDCLSSPASSSARSKPQYLYSESVLDVEKSKENVTVTVRFRPLRYIMKAMFAELKTSIFSLVLFHSEFRVYTWAVPGKSNKERRLHGMQMGKLLWGTSIIHQLPTHMVSSRVELLHLHISDSISLYNSGLSFQHLGGGEWISCEKL